MASEYLYLAFFAYLGIVMLRWTLQQHEVDAETIYGAVSVYLLMALVWGLAYLHHRADESRLVSLPG